MNEDQLADEVEKQLAEWISNNGITAELTEFLVEMDDGDDALIWSRYDPEDPDPDRPGGPSGSRVVWLGDDIGPDEVHHYDDTEFEDEATPEGVLEAIARASECRAIEVSVDVSPAFLVDLHQHLEEVI